MYNILTLNKISKVGLATLTDNYTVADECANPDGILLRSYKMHDMELPQSLKAVARCGAGVNNIPLDKCADAGVVVFNTPGANANAVKELVLTALLISSRNIVGAYNWAQSLNGTEGVAAAVEKGKSQFVGPEITGKTLAIIGLGAIGVLAANAAVALGMNVVGYDAFLSTRNALKLDPAVKVVDTPDEAYAVADYITIHVPYMPATDGMINADVLAKCKDGVRVINLARGELVKADDIKAALESGKVSYYVCDFPNDNNVGVKNIITLPHIGASTPEAEDNCASMAAVEMMDYLENGNITNSVNYPAVKANRVAGKNRICVLSKNVEGIADRLAAGAKGIAQINSNARGNYAYTIIDADSVDVNGVDGVIRVIEL
jgi:D-3-phosphoglycerate dehydrogenase